MIRQAIQFLCQPSDIRSVRAAMKNENEAPPTLILAGMAAHFGTWTDIEGFIAPLERHLAERAIEETQL